MERTNVIIVESDEAACKTVSAWLEKEGGIAVVGEAGSVAEAMQMAHLRQADAILSEARLTDSLESGQPGTPKERLARVEMIVLGKHRLESSDSFATTANRYVLADYTWTELSQTLRQRTVRNSLGGSKPHDGKGGAP
ncbi:MAG: hypothetical protein M1358_00945 [Chloroflexi bacterium]|nr:hypothetical protein [Chloroflexota bacterium]